MGMATEERRRIFQNVSCWGWKWWNRLRNLKKEKKINQQRPRWLKSQQRWQRQGKDWYSCLDVGPENSLQFKPETESPVEVEKMVRILAVALENSPFRR
jgi:hypothetical protein